MTLTAIMPTLRATIPDPIAPDQWPLGTHATTTDLVVGGVSLHDLAVLCRTPCVHTVDAVPAGPRGTTRARPAETIVLMSVRGVALGADGVPHLAVDADLSRVRVAWPELRLIGRVSRARMVLATVRQGDGAAPAETEIHVPRDVRAGDLLAVPCGGTLRRRDVCSRDAR
ncbi:conserved hypothetical protein [Beutenbergia cavernae DSM 12333]|uniref:Uncharacterized protein n=1 Tax=Beutenbergia cavernae (strain ATCC BAA-8 / DSM 12333 / CCUG 43141 / JCM 11478 / NBRC 16432 / NCIMB 13614 / HKI 0122) TaxID=471853 RepID=C5C6J1_BEUC1|nr:hypothetical protein [Beutenbergia cavernae]ACQ80397.1 conserved hypothetical protein [Beutenbergia cavernae DSM 12333]